MRVVKERVSVFF